MIQLTVALVRLPNLTRTEFQAHWAEHHAPLVKRLAPVLAIRRYVQLHSVDPPEAPYDGLAQVWYDSLEAFETALAALASQEALRLILEDERRFIDRRRSPRWWGVEHAVI
jgi:uncharacterized protein (TIGR02118 family)